MRVVPVVVAAVALGALSLGAQAPQDTGAPEEGWSGTASITRTGSGPLGAGQANHHEEIRYTLRPDGTAGYTSTYTMRVDVPEYPPIQSTGRSAGETYWMLGYLPLLGGGWDVSVAGGEVRARLDRTSVGQVLYDMLVAPFYGKQAIPPIIEDELKPIAGFMDFVRRPASARVLQGGATATVPLGAMQNLVPLAEQVSWSLTKGPVTPTPAVRIYGPSCGCLDAENPAATRLTFTAGATRRGGEFSEFELSSEGEAPTVVTNAGGAQPTLELEARQTTGPVTLRIRYRHNGRTYDAPPFRVEFCAMKPIELDDPSGDFAFGSNGQAEIKARQEVWLNGRSVNDQVSWTLDAIPAPTSQKVEPASARGERITFTYTGLPRRNDDFGPRRLTSTVKTATCDCSRDQVVRTFFMADEANNPEGKEPNWYFYWRQTGAVSPDARGVTMEFRAFLPVDPGLPSGGTVAARWEGRDETLYIGSEASGLCALPRNPALPHDPSGRKAAEGIDCFAELIRHEMQHRRDFITWWGSPKGPHGLTRLEWWARDFDLDQVPNVIEDGLPGCRSGAPTQENKFSCDARPVAHVPDVEINAYYVGWAWPLGQVNHQDWSCDGVSPKQWKGRTCR